MTQLPNQRAHWLLLPVLLIACATLPDDQLHLAPDPLVTIAGQTVETAEQWRHIRRPEILEQFRRHMYGRAPAAPTVQVEAVTEALAFDGKARRKQWRVRYDDAEDAFFEVLMYLPLTAAEAWASS